MPKIQNKTENKIRVRFKSYDHRLLDKYLKEFVNVLKKEGVQIRGPVPLPTEIKRYTVNRSPFIYKDSREQFEIIIHKRLIDVINPTPRILEIFNSLDLPAGIEVEIKIY